LGYARQRGGRERPARDAARRSRWRVRRVRIRASADLEGYGGSGDHRVRPGRTARINGTEGTDHGTATVAFLAGGAIRGGRVIADWPGLKTAQLHEGRDLKATTDLRAVMKGLLADHLGLGANILAASVFPESGAVKPMSGLVV